MGVETFHSAKSPTPSRITNCGEMVPESVIQQLEEELILEDMPTESRLQSPSGRKLLVAMKLNEDCQDILEWTLTELAMPGDQILAFHVSSCSMDSVTSSSEHEEYLEQLADTFGGFLGAYEDFCNLKQIKLEVEILRGIEFKKVMVDYARSHETCTLILGSNKHFTIRRNKSLGRYCLRRLPYTCTVVAIQHSEIILNEQGKLRTSTGAGMIKTLQRSLKSFGRSSKKAMDVGSDEGLDDPPRPCEALHLELELCRSGQGLSSNSRDFDTPRLTEAKIDFESEDLLIPGWPLMHHLIAFDKERHTISLPYHPHSDEESPAPSPLHLLSSKEEKSAPNSIQSCTPDKVKSTRSPLHRMFSDLKRSFPNQSDRQMSIVDWALKLPSQSKDPSKSLTSMTFVEDVYSKLLQEIALDAFRAGSDHVVEEISTQHSVEISSTDLSRANEKEEFILNVTKIGDIPKDGTTSLAQKLDSLYSDRKCITFVYEDLEAGTSNFSSGNVVGRGGGSEVYKGKMPDGRLVAVKRLNCGPQAEDELLNDVDINTSLSHPHIVSFLGYCIDSSHLILVYNYLSEGNLEDHLHAAGTKVPILPWRVRYKVAVGTAKALDYLHHGTSRPVIHRDVKSSNILLTSDFESQLSDFGLAKWAPKKASHILCDDILGTFGYLAPEYFMYGRVNNKTDVYAFGVVLLELITGQTPIDNTKPKGQENLVNWARPLLEENNLEKLVDSRLEAVYDVDQMKRMLLAASLCVQESPQRRPQMSQVLQILCSSHGRLQSLCRRREESEESMCVDLEEGDIHTEETPTFGRCTSDIQTHLALAMLGVDDDLIPRSTLDHNGIDLLHHLEGRFNLSSSLVQ